MKVDFSKAQRIVSFGCSYIFGDEFPDMKIGVPSQLTYPALLAQHYGLDYKSYAERGGSNESIMRKLVDYYQNEYVETDVVIIGLTYTDRRDFFNSDLSRYMSFFPSSNQYRLENLHTVHPKYEHESVERMINASNVVIEYDTDHEVNRRYQHMLFYLSTFLKQHDIRHMIFFSERGCLQQAVEKKNMSSVLDGLVYFDRAFLEYSIQLAKTADRFDFYPLGHPNEAIHEHWAEKVIRWNEDD